MAALDGVEPPLHPTWPVLPGRSAEAIGRLAWRLTVTVVLPLFVVVLVLLFLQKTNDGVLVNAFHVVVFLFLLTLLAIAGIGGVWRFAREYREVAYGYTSLQGSHLDVCQVLPDTDHVIRGAGEPALSDKEYEQLLSGARPTPLLKLRLPSRVTLAIALGLGIVGVVVRLVTWKVL